MNIKSNSIINTYRRQIKTQMYIIAVLMLLCIVSITINVKAAAYMMEQADNSINGEIVEEKVEIKRPEPNIVSTEKPFIEIIQSPLTSLVHEKENSTVSDYGNETKLDIRAIRPLAISMNPIELDEIFAFNVVEEETTEIVEEQREEIVEKTTPEIVFPENEIMGNEELDKEAFKKAVADIAPELIDTVDALFVNYETYGLKPSFPLAVACLESGYGKSGLARNKNNLYGMGAYAANGLSAYQHAFTYTSKTESVLDFGERIYNKYIQKGLTSLESINKKYCPPNQSWASHVRSIKNKIERLYETYAL